MLFPLIRSRSELALLTRELSGNSKANLKSTENSFGTGNTILSEKNHRLKIKKTYQKETGNYLKKKLPV
ncbi:Hypothetical protein P9211_01181 [Prochlorococcus marinus str. MIT 9211]|uniref:Uncharacterized protein n=1 Tax=Prochlorococcus marinus (strain MIT 9211) TaxID=93059 RepID=A9BCW1_PROM4|nr:Hypothetical protein P9211_01181 [Prochlorococcus marinus str. MIT 9211]